MSVARPAALSENTLRKTSGFYAPQWHHAGDRQLVLTTVVEEAGLDPQHAPPIGIVATRDGEKVAGRFFPKVTHHSHRYVGPAILVYRHNDDLVTLATMVHELAHFASYCAECSHVPRNRAETVRCRYKGEHDAEFYARLEPMYRAAGVPTYAARAVEGHYDYPAHWKEENWTA